VTSSIEIIQIEDAAGRERFIRFPWQVYRNDPLWVPPLLSSRRRTLDPARGTFFKYGEAALFMARRAGKDVGTIVGWINHRSNRYLKEKAAGFGFFEVLDDYPAAEALLTAACDWARQRGMTEIRGPFYFSMDDCPGVLIEGFDYPPVLLVGHTPPYYAGLLEQFGLEKYRDGYAYRMEAAPFNNDLGNLPPKILRVAEVVRRREKVTVRAIRMNEWDNEVGIAMDIINRALGHMRNHVPMDEGEFKRFAESLRSVVDPDLALLAEVDGKPVGIAITLPDFNQALRHANGRLFPVGWLKVLWHKRQINVATFKILGILEEYRGRGLDSLLYIETAKAIMAKGHEWIDLSLVAENNVMMNRMARRLGGEIYKVFRTYKTTLA